MWKRSFRERPPSKSASGKTKLSCETSSNSDSWRCENVAFVRDLRPPWKSESWRCENEAFVRDLPENLKVEAVKTKLSCETWDVPKNLKVEDVKTKLSCKTSLKKWKWKMWKRSLRARPPSNSDSWRCENVAFVRDLPENLKVEDVKTKLSCEGETSLKKWKWKMWKGSRLRARLETPLKIWKLKMWKRSFRARPPWKSESGRCENEAFVRDLRRPSKSESWRCENEAVVRDLSQNLKVEDVKTKLSCKTSLKKWKWKMWKRSFRARPPSKSESWRCEGEAFVRDLRRPSKSESWRCENEAFVRDLPEKVKVEDVKRKPLACETWDAPQNLKVEDVKMKLSCETSLKIWKLKMWKRSFRARPPWKSESWRCEHEAFVRDLPEKVKVEDVKTKL